MRNRKIWGSTANRKVKVDTTPPVFNKIKMQYTSCNGSSIALVDFSAEDSSSGVDHYEVAITDVSNNTNISPAFFTAESPYKGSLDNRNDVVFVARAIDHAGNTTDASINIKKLSKFGQFFSNNKTFVLGFVILILVGLYVFHFLKDHRVFKVIGLLNKLIKAESKKLEIKEEVQIAEEEKIVEEVADKETKIEPASVKDTEHTHKPDTDLSDLPR